MSVVSCIDSSASLPSLPRLSNRFVMLHSSFPSRSGGGVHTDDDPAALGLVGVLAPLLAILLSGCSCPCSLARWTLAAGLGGG